MTQAPAGIRRHPRYVVDVEAKFALADGNRRKARTRDLSRNGICLITADPVPAGSDVLIELVLAFGDDAFSEPLTLRARVVWCTSIAESFQVGAMFDELSDEQDQFLDMFVQYLDGTLSPKGVAEPEEDNDVPTGPIEDKDDPFR